VVEAPGKRGGETAITKPGDQVLGGEKKKSSKRGKKRSTGSAANNEMTRLQEGRKIMGKNKTFKKTRPETHRKKNKSNIVGGTARVIKRRVQRSVNERQSGRGQVIGKKKKKIGGGNKAAQNH